MTTAAGRSYGGRSPEDRRLDRRRRLLDAGLELYGTKGYAATTITELCRAASVAPNKFYEQFETQEQVLVAIAQEVGHDATTAIFAAMEHPDASLEDAIRQGLRAFCHSLLDDPRRAQIFQIEIVGVSAAVERRRREILERFASMLIRYFWLLARGVTEPPPPTPREQFVASALVGAVQEAMVAWLFHPDRPAIDELVESLTGVFTTVATWLATTTP
jgi:AcrR family transcriptional regulator